MSTVARRRRTISFKQRRRLGLVGSARLGWARLGWAQLVSAWLVVARGGLARLDLAVLGLALLASAWLASLAWPTGGHPPGRLNDLGCLGWPGSRPAWMADLAAVFHLTDQIGRLPQWHEECS